MDDKKLNKIANIIIHILILCLIGLIIYNMFLLINRNYYSTDSPKNSIKVGPISEEERYTISNINI